MSGGGGRVLLVEDNEDLRFAMRRFLARRHFDVVEAGTVAEAVERFDERLPDVVIVDYKLPDGDGLELLATLRRDVPKLSAIVLTGRATVELAVRAIKQGADQFLRKPVDMESLVLMTRRLCEAQESGGEERATEDDRGELNPFLGDSPAVRRLEADAELVAGSSLPVLIEGPTGSGKGVLARWLHAHGERRNESWVDLNCAGLSHQLLESELFGHERGAFTGAVSTKPGLLEVADRGTLFLDEIGDMGPEVQPRLLKVLEEKSFRRLGAVRDRTVDVRLIAATHHDLHERVRQGAFRLDLLYRIESVRLVVPALKDRGGDVLDLARDLVARLATPAGRDDAKLEDSAEKALLAHSWPGNIRELKNVIERALLFVRDRDIGAGDVSRAIANGRSSRIVAAGDGGDGDISLEAAERRHIRATLGRFCGDVRAAAEALGISRSGLYKKLQRHGLSPSDTVGG